MIVQSFLAEFEHEVKGTRALLNAIPEKDLGYKPSPVSWTMGELAQHIATIYYWYVGTVTQTVYDMAADKLERGAPDDLPATIRLFESNVEKARAALQELREENLRDEWTMKVGERTVLGPMKRVAVLRGFVFNHVYHHRGELVIYLRATGNKVPGLYGPTYEESAGKQQG